MTGESPVLDFIEIPNLEDDGTVIEFSDGKIMFPPLFRLSADVNNKFPFETVRENILNVVKDYTKNCQDHFKETSPECEDTLIIVGHSGKSINDSILKTTEVWGQEVYKGHYFIVVLPTTTYNVREATLEEKDSNKSCHGL